MKPPKILLFFILIFIFLCNALSAQEQEWKSFEEWFTYIKTMGFQQITTHPDIDINPGITPDGTKIIFTSRRKGATESRNLDIWIRSIKNSGSPQQITVHTSADMDGVFSPDGKKVLIVSRRNDVYGDIWIIENIDNPNFIKSKRITNYIGEDSAPDWHPDGEKIVFTSDRTIKFGEQNSQKNIWLYEMKEKKFSPITTEGGFDPTFSPDGRYVLFTSFRKETGNGDLWIKDLKSGKLSQITSGAAIDGFGDWSPTGKSIVFTRFDRDTNNNRKVTTEDNSGIFLLDLEFTTRDSIIPLKLKQLTTFENCDYLPTFDITGENIFFTSDRGGNLDIWSMPKYGAIPDAPNAAYQIRFAQKIQQEGNISKTILAYQKVIANFPESNRIAAEAQLEIGKIYESMDDSDRAILEYQRVLENYEKTKIKPFAEIAIAKLNFDQGNSGQIETLNILFSSYKNDAFVATKILLTLGEMYLQNGDYHFALSIYRSIIEQYPTQIDACAQAQIKIGDIYSQFGDKEQVLQIYLEVLEKYFIAPQWNQMAIDKILQLLVSADNLNEQLYAYHDVIEKYPQFTSLAAQAQYNIAETFRQVGKPKIALSEFSILAENYPNEEVMIAKSVLAQCKIYLEIQDDLKAIRLLQNSYPQYQELEEGKISRQMKALLLETLLRQGKKFLALREGEKATNFFWNAVSVDSLNIEAHRGLVRSFYQADKIDKMIEHYENKRENFPEVAVYHYALGYAYTFKFSEDNNTKYLKKAEQSLRNALDFDFRMLYAYLTLGWVYEGLEKEEEIENGYERGIDLYRIALNLNDETQNPKLEADLCLNIANNYFNFVETTEFGYQEAYHYYKEKLHYDSTFQNSKQEMVINERIGRCAFYMGDYDEGDTYYLRAIQIAKERNDIYTQYDLCRRIGAFYQQGEIYENSIKFFKQALEILDELKLNANKKKEQRRILYRNISFNYYQDEEFEKAIYWGKRAENLLGRPGETFQKPTRPLKIELLGLLGIHTKFLTIPIPLPEIRIGLSKGGDFTLADEQALTYNIIAESYFQLQDFGNAVEYFNKKLDVFFAQKDELGKAILHNNLGYLHYLLGDYGSAMYHFESSVILCNRNDMERALVNNFQNINVVLSTLFEREAGNRGMYEKLPAWQGKKALRYQKWGLDLVQNFKSEQLFWRYKDKIDEVALYNGMANVYLYLSKIRLDPRYEFEEEEQESFWEFDLQLDVPIYDRYYADAIAYYKEALYLTEQYNLARMKTILNKNLGNAYLYQNSIKNAMPYLMEAEDLAKENGYLDILWRIENSIALAAVGDKNAQLKYFSEALNILENMPSRMKKSREQHSYLYEKLELYENMISLLVANGRTEESLSYLERMRNKNYVDLFSSYTLNLKSQMHNIIYRWGEEIKSRQFEIASLGGEVTEEEWKRLESLEKHLDFAQKEYNKLMEKENDSQLLSLFRVQETDWGKIQEILDEETLILNYSVNRDNCNLWAISKEKIWSYTIPISRQKLIDSIITYREAIEERKPIKEVNAKGAGLYELLLSPIDGLLDSYYDLMIIPDECLFYLPFSSLRRQGSYLIEEFTLHFLPSAYSYIFAHNNRNVNTIDALIVKGKHRANSSISHLDAEMEAMRNLNKETWFLANQDNLKEMLSQKIEEYGYIHFTTLEKVRTESPLNSYFYLTNEDKFSVFEIYAHNLQANLLFFSNSTTQLEGAGNGDDIIALTRGAFYAGVPSVLFSLWNVQQESRIDFVRQFYSGLNSYKKSEALADAQLAIIEEYEHPYFWAGFTLWGYEGMSTEESELFANQELDKTFLLAKQNKQQDPEFALRLLESAIALDLRLGGDHLKQIYSEMVVVAYSLGRYEKAANTQVKLLKMAEDKNNKSEIVYSYKTIVRCYELADQLEKAMDYEEEYIDFLAAEKDSTALAEAYIKLSLLNRDVTDYEDAKENLEKSFEIYKNQNNSNGKASAHFYMGQIYELEREFYTALEYYKEAYEFFEAAEDVASMAVIEKTMGIVYEKLALYDEALAHQEKALEFSEKLDNMLLKGQSLQKIADAYWLMGNYQQAFNYQRQALDVAKELQNIELLRTSHTTLGLLYFTVGNLEKALELEERALDFSIEEEAKPDRASIFSNIGLIYRRKGNYELALSYFQKALELDKELNSSWGQVQSYRNIGVTFRLLENYDFALENLEKAYQLSLEIRDLRSQALSLFELGNVYYRLNKLDEAKDYFAQGLQIAETYSLIELKWRCHRGIGNILRKEGNLEKAHAEFTIAIEIVESIRATLKIEEYKGGFMENKMELYDDMITLLMQLERPEAAFDYAEKAKSRNFIDILGNQKIDLYMLDNTDLIEQERKLQDQIDGISAQITSVAAKEPPDTLEIQRLKQKLSKLRSEYSQFLNRVQEKNPELLSLVSVEPASLPQIQQHLDAETAILKYYLTEKNLVIWIIEKNHLSAKIFDVSEVTISELIKTMRDAIEVIASVDEPSRKLYDFLIAPIRGQISGKKRLGIIPHGVLHYLPFAALLNENKKYLLEDYSLFYAPSATVLHHCYQKRKEGGKTEDILAFGNPKLQTEDWELPFSEKELISVDRWYRYSDTFKEQQATETAAKGLAGITDLLLFSCHGEFDAQNPLFSNLRLAPDSLNDGRLEVHEIFGLNLTCQLVALSACETGVGKITEGDEVIGLTRAFIYAGAPRVLATLWRVDDLSTAVTVKRFFRYLRNRPPAEALRDAQLLVKKYFPHPAHWASFTLTGIYE